MVLNKLSLVTITNTSISLCAQYVDKWQISVLDAVEYLKGSPQS